MNGILDRNSKAEIRKSLVAALTGLNVNTKGLVTSHDEALTKEGAEAIWDRLVTRDLKVVRDE